jgi:glycosyltransferase involved in cell wall biosynthesis
MNTQKPFVPRSPSTAQGSVLVVYNTPSRFVLLDCELLAKSFCVTARYEPSPWRLKLAQIWREVRRHDLVFCWFASWHSFFPVLAARILAKPSVVVVGGFDTANVPQADYGSQRGGLRKTISTAIIRTATHLIVNSASARGEAMKNTGVDAKKISLIYHGIPCQTAMVPKCRKRMALTVGVVSRDNLLRKGLLPFVRAAKRLPDVHFVHAGPWLDDAILNLRQEAASNVEFLGFVSDEALASLYFCASVYVQASLHEGFGMSLAEAMAGGCIPVVTRCTALPEVAGDSGIYIAEPTPEAIANGVVAALQCSYDARMCASKRILEIFSIAQREQGLRAILARFISRDMDSSANTRLPMSG